MHKFALKAQSIVTAFVLLSTGAAFAQVAGQQQDRDQNRQQPPQGTVGPLQGANPQNNGPQDTNGPLQGANPNDNGAIAGTDPQGNGPLQNADAVRGAGPLQGGGPLQGARPVLRIRHVLRKVCPGFIYVS